MLNEANATILAQCLEAERARSELLCRANEGLAAARSRDAVVAVLRASARDLCRSDGVSVILREGETCRYVGEDAVGPLWVGQTFKLDDCISGIAMRTGATIVIPDVSQDPRIGQHLYRGTFVRAMAMAPIGLDEPAAAVGVYWATLGQPSLAAVTALEQLARTAGVALRNVALYESLAAEADRSARLAASATRELNERRQAEAALRASEERLRFVLAAGRLGSWDLDLASDVITMSDACRALFAIPPTASALREDLAAAILPDDRPAFREAVLATQRTGAPIAGEFRLNRPTGEVRWFDLRGRAFHDVGGALVGIAGIAADITERKRAERVRQEAEAELRRLNETLEERVAQRTAELAASNRQLVGQIAERERVADTLRQMQRLEAVGQLTSGVAHDFNNLLTVILGNLGFIRRGIAGLPAEAKLTSRLSNMESAAERGAKLTGQLLAFSRRQRLEAKPIDLNASVNSLRELLRSTMGGSARIETVLAPRLWPALVDPTQIELVILNLAINARDAMRVGGSLGVETSNVVLSEAPTRPEEPEPGDYVVIAVRDDGHGMSPEIRAKAFEPFFTTKEIGKGTGLGLSQVLGFAKQSGGGVRIATEPGKGTTVWVYLPRSLRGLDGETCDERGEHDAPGGGATVLLVDDDPAVREVTAAMLREADYEVIEAGSGGAGLDALDRAERVDLLLVDFAMPGMNGAEVAREAQIRRPSLPILFVTGYADLDAIRSIAEDRIVAKPFQFDRLLQAIERALGARPDPAANVLRLAR